MWVLGVSTASAQNVPPEQRPAGASDDPADEAGETPAEEEARRRFDQGVALARAGQCRAALGELEASLTALPRASTAYNIGQCEENLGNYDRALAAYEQYLRLAAADHPLRAQVEQTMISLSGLLGTLEISTNVAAEVWVDDVRRGTTPLALRLPGGRHRVEVRQSGYHPERREVALAARSREAVLLELQAVALEPPPGPVTTRVERVTITEQALLPSEVFWSVTVGAAAAAVAAAVLGGYALARRASARDADPFLPKDDDKSAIARAALAADIAGLAAIGLAVGATALYFQTDWGPPAGSTVSAHVDAQRFGISVSGRL